MCDSCLPGHLGGCRNSRIPDLGPPAPITILPAALASATSVCLPSPPTSGVSGPSVVVSQSCMSISQPCISLPSTPVSVVQPTVTSVTTGCTASLACVSNTPTVCQTASPPHGHHALPSLDTVLHMHVATLHHVPKGARDAWAGILGDVLQSICSDPSIVASWVKFFMLARCILSNPARGGRSHWREILKTVRARIAKWRDGEVVELWEGVVAENDRLKRHHCRRPSSIESLRLANARRAHRAVEDGHYRKAIQSLSSAGLASATADVVDEMVAKHPQAGPSCIPSGTAPSPVQVREVDIVRALRSFPSGTAPGPSSFRANHFKEAVFCPSPDRANYALQGLLGVINLLCAGRAPPMVSPHLCGASLFNQPNSSL